ncbi:MAG: lytic transglycosylase domain-containing protein [Spirochaetes bacterium]|nr:lytic transglycosylase domain-containing protein [Spirochaetota bacterium]
MRKNFLILLFIILLISCSSQQSSGKNLAVLGFNSTPENIISTLESDAASYADHYLLARAYLRKNDQKKALYHFINCAFVYQRNKNIRLFPGPIYKFLNEFHIKSDYYDDAAYAIAKILHAYREFDYAVKIANLVEKRTSALYRETLILKAKALSDLNRHHEAIEILLKGLDFFKENETRALLHIRLGSTYSDINEEKNAIEEYFRAIEINPAHWHAAVAAEQILNILKKSTLVLEKSKKITLAKALYYTKKYEESANILSAILSEQKTESDETIEFLLKSFIRLNKIDAAQKIISKTKEKNKNRDLTRIVADELWDAGNQKSAADIYHILSKGNDDIAHHALARLCTFSEKRKLPNFENLLHEFISKYPNDDRSSHIAWILARSYIRKNDFTAAKSVIEKSLTDQPTGKYSDHHRYWLYRMLLKSEKKDVALDILTDMVEINPDSSYTWSALEKVASEFTIEELQTRFENCTSEKCQLLYHALLGIKESDLQKIQARLKKYPFGNREPYIKLERAISSCELSSDYKESLKSLKKYFIVGDAESIFREISFLPQDDEVLNDIHIAIAHFSDKFDFYHRSAYSTIQLFKAAKLQPNFFLMEPKTIQRLYPLAFYECVQNASKKYGFDIPTMYAIIRAESLYNHEALSPAGAVGLMQIMPSTARHIAKELGLESYNLKDPCTSIEMGAYYFKKLEKAYNGKLELMIAAYNAGPTNVSKWVEQFPADDLHLFIEQVPFDETRYYMLRAKKNFLQGKFVYRIR